MIRKLRYSDRRYQESPYGYEEWERDFERWENAVIEEGEERDLEEISEDEQC